MNDIIQYKNRVASRLMALALDQIAARVPDGMDYFASVKLDGHFAGLLAKDGTVRFYNRSGKELNLPQLAAAAQKILGNRELALAGELYVEGGAERARSFHVSEALADESRHDLRFAAFDIVGSTDKLDVTLEQLKTWLPSSGKLHHVAQTVLNSRAAVLEMYKKQVEQAGHEGIVLRAADRSGFKIKTRHSLDLVVIGYSEGSGDQAGMLRNMLLAAMHPDGSFQVVGKVGTGFSDEQRREWLGRLAAMHTPSEFVEVTERQTAFEMVRPEWVIECACIDMLVEDGSRSVTKMALRHAADTGYTIAGRHPSVNLIAPVFIRVRDDKTVNPVDLRFSQISDAVELESREQVLGAPSALLRRAVYVKETKGEIAVRKFVAWKTNKESTGEFPAYVVMYTDFSPNRAEMLKQEINVAPREDAANALFDACVAENIKKGWVAR